MIELSPILLGKKFIVTSSKEEWTCIGWASNDTFLIVGSFFDSVNNRSEIKTFKFGDIRFMGAL